MGMGMDSGDCVSLHPDQMLRTGSGCGWEMGLKQGTVAMGMPSKKERLPKGILDAPKPTS